MYSFTQACIIFLLLFVVVRHHFKYKFTILRFTIYKYTLFFIKEALAGYPNTDSRVCIAVLFYPCNTLISQTYHTFSFPFSWLVLNGQRELSAILEQGWMDGTGNILAEYETFSEKPQALYCYPEAHTKGQQIHSIATWKSKRKLIRCPQVLRLFIGVKQKKQLICSVCLPHKTLSKRKHHFPQILGWL